MATKNPLQIEVYCRDGATYHWRMWRSGQIVAESGGPGHVKQAQCKRTLLRLIGTLQAEAFVWKEPTRVIGKAKAYQSMLAADVA